MANYVSTEELLAGKNIQLNQCKYVSAYREGVFHFFKGETAKIEEIDKRLRLEGFVGSPQLYDKLRDTGNVVDKWLKKRHLSPMTVSNYPISFEVEVTRYNDEDMFVFSGYLEYPRLKFRNRMREGSTIRYLAPFFADLDKRIVEELDLKCLLSEGQVLYRDVVKMRTGKSLPVNRVITFQELEMLEASMSVGPLIDYFFRDFDPEKNTYEGLLEDFRKGLTILNSFSVPKQLENRLTLSATKIITDNE